LTETVVISCKTFEERAAPARVRGVEEEEAALAETVVLSPGGFAKKTPEEPSDEPSGDEFFTETVVLSPDKIEKKDR
jgi:hypothetical protein